LAKPLRIGIFVTGAFVRPEYAEAVSGHVQIPLMAAKMLFDAGNNVTLITTRPHAADCLPAGLPRELDVHVVQHATRPWPQHGVYPHKAIRQMWQLRTLLGKQHFDVVHFFGGPGTGLLLGVLTALGGSSIALYTPVKIPPVSKSWLRSKLGRSIFRHITLVLATSEYVSHGWASWVGEKNTRVLHPGVTKQILDSPGPKEKDSVLFWRNAGYDNGVDIVIQSFRRLAPKYPDIQFVFAVRPHDAYEQQILMLTRENENIEVHIYPYKNGVSLAGLLRRSRFVIQPFRHLSVNPQISILETLYAGVPVITTSIESNSEVVHHERNGLLIPPGDEARLSSAIERLLNDTPLLTTLTQNARAITEERWNWQSFGQGLVQAYEGLR
jgi:glycosyltransferase involved in cell wall biosynthesis